jgi:hypothetical protein
MVVSDGVMSSSSSVEETVHHLFLDCQFAKDCWNMLGITIQDGTDIFQAVNQIRDQSHPVFFLVVVILMCWAIWNVRNDLIFKGRPPDPSVAKDIFLKEIKILSLRVKVKLSGTFDLWIQNLLSSVFCFLFSLSLFLFPEHAAGIVFVLYLLNLVVLP